MVVLVACEPATPSRVVAEEVIAAPPVVAERKAPVVVDAVVADRYPSLAYYPDLGAKVAAARADGARAVLAAIVESLEKYRWPGVLDWDRNGFIDVRGARPGFVTRVSGLLKSQPGDRHDLGCAGGFLEGVRMTLVPDMAIDELDRCDVEVAVEGGPAGCEPEREYGWLALRNVAGRLRAEQLPAGARMFELAPAAGPAGISPLAAPGAMHLCTVSHESAARGEARLYHHLMIVLATEDADDIEVFDTTGLRGVALTRMTRARFVNYCANQLAASREYRYRGRSARVTCLAVSPA